MGEDCIRKRRRSKRKTSVTMIGAKEKLDTFISGKYGDDRETVWLDEESMILYNVSIPNSDLGWCLDSRSTQTNWKQ